MQMVVLALAARSSPICSDQYRRPSLPVWRNSRLSRRESRTGPGLVVVIIKIIMQKSKMTMMGMKTMQRMIAPYLDLPSSTLVTERTTMMTTLTNKLLQWLQMRRRYGARLICRMRRCCQCYGSRSDRYLRKLQRRERLLCVSWTLAILPMKTMLAMRRRQAVARVRVATTTLIFQQHLTTKKKTRKTKMLEESEKEWIRPWKTWMETWTTTKTMTV
mmetsp:Transcript_10952/g.23699  ORF Transcript_10952/g.23699 Transcript_10952/m.23699 type:complete len:217 (+) Transcript_10952:356-1006(+)